MAKPRPSGMHGIRRGKSDTLTGNVQKRCRGAPGIWRRNGWKFLYVKQRDLTGATAFIRPFNKASKNRRSGVRASIRATKRGNARGAKGRRKVDVSRSTPATNPAASAHRAIAHRGYAKRRERACKPMIERPGMADTREDSSVNHGTGENDDRVLNGGGGGGPSQVAIVRLCPSAQAVYRLESRMREIRPSGLAAGEAGINRPSLPR